MRDILTGLAILLIVAISAAMAVPYFIDWTSYRGEFEQRLAQAAGVPVSIDGPIDLKLLPTPSLTLQAAAAGQPGKGPILTVGRVRLEIAVMPLLKGDIQVIEARLDGPRLEGTLAPGGTVEGLGDVVGGLGAARSVIVNRLVVTGGSVGLTDAATGRQLAVSGIDLDADAGALAGPWRANGRLLAGDRAFGLRLLTGAPEAGGTRLKLTLDRDGGAWRGNLDGRLASGGSGLAFDGRIATSGRVRWPDRDGFAQRPWSAGAQLRWAGRAGTLEGIEIEGGGDEAPVKFTGTGTIDGGASPRLSLTLEARQIDLDRALTGPVTPGQPSPPAPLGATLAAWLAALGQEEGVSGLPLPVALTLSVPNVIAGGDTVAGVAVDATLQDGAIRVAKATAALPGTTTLQARGDGSATGGGRFDGHVTLSTRDFGRLTAWFEGERAGRSPRVGDVREMTFDADVSLSPAVLAARSMRLSLDRSQVVGALRYSPPEQGARGRFEAQLTSDGLSIDQIPDLSTLTGAARGLDVSLTLDARNVRVGPVAGTAVGAGRVGLRLTATPEQIDVSALDITDVGGATVRASGRVGAAGGRMEATVDARRVEPLADLLRKVVPGKAPALLAARAGSLGPLRLRLTAERAGSGEARLTATGTAAATQVNATMALGGPQGEDRLTGSFRAEAPDAAAFLTQLGFEALPLPGFGRGRLAAEVDGRLGQGAALTVSGEAAGVQLSGEGRLGLGPQDPALAGTVSLDTADIGPILQILALPGPDGLGRIPVQMKARASLAGEVLTLEDLSGRFFGEPVTGRLALDAGRGRLDGALDLERLSLASLSGLALGRLQAPLPGNLWPAGRFGGVLPPPVDTTVRLSARRLDLGFGSPASGATATLRWTPEALEVMQADMAVTEGRLAGGFTIRRQGGLAALSFKMAGRDLDASVLLPRAGIAGRADAELDGSGSSETVAGLVGGLSGGGVLRLRGGGLARFDPKALPAITAAFDAERDPPDLGRVRDALGAALDRGALAAGALEAPVTLSGGVLRAGPMGTKAEGIEIGGSVSFDLRNGRTEARATLVAEPPPGWSGPAPQAAITWRPGRSGALERDIDVAALTNVLTTRAVARELERIEAAESDLRERSFFLRRTKADRERLERERREEEEARLAEEARKAEEARQAEEARRAEQARIEEEARRAEQARREAEARRLEDERKAEEARRLEQERRADELRRQEDARRAEEQRRADELRRQEEARRAEEQRRATEQAAPTTAPPAQPSAPAAAPGAQGLPQAGTDRLDPTRTNSIPDKEDEAAGVEEAARLLGVPSPRAGGQGASPVVPLPPPSVVGPAPGSGIRQPLAP
ncbi:AsmA family protein [Alsobacter sp. R-9]